MSFDALAWAAKQQAGSSGAKLVLLGLAECAGRKDAMAFPSIAELVEFSNLNRKSIITNLAKLEALGLIEDTGNCVGRTKQIKVYRLCLETVPKTEQSQKRNSSAFSVNSPKNGTRNQSEPVIVDESETRKRAILALPQWRAFKAMRSQIKKPINPTAESRLLAKLLALEDAGYPPGEVLDQSTEHCWQGVFKIEERENGTANRGNQRSMGGPRPDPTLAIVRAAIEAQRESGGDYRQARPALPPG